MYMGNGICSSIEPLDYPTPVKEFIRDRYFGLIQSLQDKINRYYMNTGKFPKAIILNDSEFAIWVLHNEINPFIEFFIYCGIPVYKKSACVIAED